MSFISEDQLRHQRDEAIRENSELRFELLVARREMLTAQAMYQKLEHAMIGFGSPAGCAIDAAWRANEVCAAADRIELDHPHVPGHVLPDKPKSKYGKPCPGCALRDALLVWRPMGKP